jgi:hypothetical protein
VGNILVDLTGQTFGHLTIVGRAGSTPNGKATWSCKCSLCGSTSEKPGADLRRGLVKSCGCAVQAIDLLGQTFGSLKVLRQDGTQTGAGPMWVCLCTLCNRTTTKRSGDLRHGKVKSCGCAQGRSSEDRVIDLVGQTFGVQRVLRREAPKPGVLGAQWLCECTLCRTTTIRHGNALRTGKRTSCACQTNANRGPDLVGQTFGALRVLERATASNGQTKWVCECVNCSQRSTRSTFRLTSRAASCSCLRKSRKALRERAKKYPIFGAELTVSEMARLAGVTIPCIHIRLKRGMTPAQAVGAHADT